MSAVCLKQKNSLKNESWSSIFSSYNTEAKSRLFMKQLTNICISTILYLRKIFPDNYFESRNFEGMTLKTLKSGKRFKYLDRIGNWLEGAFEAIDKKYLKHLMLDIKDADSKMTLEIYTMTYQYQNENEASMLLCSTADLTKDRSSEISLSNTQLKTVRLLQMCYAVTQSCSSLPSKVTLAIRLSYHEGTPQEYQPVGYKAWEPTNPVFPKDTRTIEMGVTNTSHHFFKLVNKSIFSHKFLKDVEDKEDSAHNSPKSKQRDKNKSSEEKKNRVKRELCFDGTENSPPTKLMTPLSRRRNLTPNSESGIYKPKEVQSQSQSQGVLESLIQSSQSQRCTGVNTFESSIFDSEAKLERVRCPCRSLEKFSVMFLCSGCRYWVHAECFGVLHFDFSKKIQFYCHLCHKDDGFKCHDKVMIRLKNPADQQKVALLRRLLKFCNLPEVTKFTFKKIEKIAGSNTSKTTMEIVLKKMIEIEVAVPQGKKKNYVVDKHKLSEKLVNYFYPMHYLNVSQSKVMPNLVRTPEPMKRKDMNTGDCFTNNKCKRLSDPSQVFDSQKSWEFSSQQSCDLFHY